MQQWSTGYEEDDVVVHGQLVVHGQTSIFTPTEKALIDILPKLKDTHPDLYLKYIDLIPEKS